MFSSLRINSRLYKIITSHEYGLNTSFSTRKWQLYIAFSPVVALVTGYPVFELLGVCQSLESARAFAQKQVGEDSKILEDLVHTSMTKENHYTFVGKRDDCRATCTYGDFGGFVIEEMQIL